MTPLISIVTGTYNRIESLKRMVESVRRAMPRGLYYELIVVDGGSTDGTLDWCRAQHDIRLIEQGALLGAIRAFCDGAKSARADYVVLANDDITFRPHSLIAAVSHLERTPTCGAVAFADNRTSLVHGDGKEYRVEVIGAVTAAGQHVSVPYAQVGMFRRELGNAVGWWGADDPIMGRARTYGGDNFLSACLWEMGFTVDAVPRAVIEDYIEADDLRSRNAAQGPKDSACYYQRFPVVRIPDMRCAVQDSPRLRIMSLPIYEPHYPGKFNREEGLTEALTDYGLAFEWDYINDGTDLIELVKAWQPDLLITQIQGVGKITSYQLASMRNAAPNMMIVNWNGDAHERGLTDPAVLDMLRYVDLQTTINAKVLPVYEREGIRAAYWQIGYKDPADGIPAMPQHEVVFQGNCYNGERHALVRTLRSLRYPNARKVNVGVYGNCANADGNTHYSFAHQRGLIQAAKIVIGDTYPGTKAFVSNRLFQTLAAGGFLLQQHSDGLEEYTGLIPGKHYIEWTDLADLKEKVMHWLDSEQDERRAAIAAAGRDYVRANFSYKAQAWKLFNELIPQIEVQHAAV